MPSLEAEDIIFATRRLGVSFIPATRQTTTCRLQFVEDHLRPAAVKAGVLSSHRDLQGQLVDDDPRRFGFHNLRHSLASFLIRIRTDPKNRTDFAASQRRQANATGLHSCCQAGSHDKIDPAPFQRDLSDTHNKRLADVIYKTGYFLDPLIAVLAPGGGFWTPNGRHRLEAMRRLGANPSRH